MMNSLLLLLILDLTKAQLTNINVNVDVISVDSLKNPLPAEYSVQTITVSSDLATTQSVCQPGYYCPTFDTQLFCPPNTWSLPGSVLGCTLPCPTGVVCPGNGKMSCSVCAPDVFIVRPCSAEGDIICNATCPPGMFGAFYTQGFCRDCDRGYYNNKYGVTACASCTANTYANTTGNSACPACPPGYTSNAFTGFINCRKVCLTNYSSCILFT